MIGLLIFLIGFLITFMFFGWFFNAEEYLTRAERARILLFSAFWFVFWPVVFVWAIWDYRKQERHAN